MFCSLIECFLRVSGVRELNALFKTIVATHMSVPHSLLFLGYEFLRQKVVRCSEGLSEFGLVGTLVPIMHDVKSFV